MCIAQDGKVSYACDVGFSVSGDSKSGEFEELACAFFASLVVLLIAC